MQKIFRIWKLKVKKAFASLMLKINFQNKKDKWETLRWKYKTKIRKLKGKETFPVIEKMPITTEKNEGFHPLVSVIVPNYNYEAFLRQRLDSIYNQTYTNFEVILLDDASTDGSVKIFEEYRKKYPGKTVISVNEQNMGTPFKAWAKGIKQAKGKLVWIAEADDWCDLNFLEETVMYFQNEAIMLAFCDTKFVNLQGEKIWSTAEYVGEKFTSNFINSAADLMKNIFYRLNIIPNASGCVFRNVGDIPLLSNPDWLSMKIAGDWLFYAHIIRGGLIAYTTKTINFFRRHPGSNITQSHKTERYFTELEIVSKYLAGAYNVNYSSLIELNNKLLKDFNAVPLSNFRKYYNLEEIIQIHKRKKINIAVANYSFMSGGGEALSIFLANEFKRQGFAVTFFDYEYAAENPEVRNMLSAEIPVVKTNNATLVSYYLDVLNIDIVQTANALINVQIAKIKKMFPTFKLVSGLHGCYEAHTLEININHFNLAAISKIVDKFIYTSEKNLIRFKEIGVYNPSKFVKILNGLPAKEINPIQRSSLGIPENAFVLCLVSRAIKEKGWKEAIDVIKYLNSKSIKREVHLVLIGDGPEYEYYKNEKLPKTIHLLGYKNNIRDYCQMSDMGFLPSKFKGESFSLVNIDCILSGKPILVSDNTPEIKELYSTEDGFAGFVFHLKEKEGSLEIPVEEIGDIVESYITDEAGYQKLLPIVKALQHKFRIEDVASNYIEEYKKLTSKPRILVLAHELSLSGGPMASLLAAKAIKKSGKEVIMLSPVDGPLKDEIEKNDIEVYISNTLNIELYKKFDLVICVCVVQAQVVSLLEKSDLDIPIIWWLHEGNGIEHSPSNSINVINNSKVNIFAGGKYSFEKSQKLTTNKNIKILNYGIEDKFQPYSSKPENDKIIFSIFGAIQPRKRQKDFIKAVTLIPAELREKCIFRIIGSAIPGYSLSEKYFDSMAKEIEILKEIIVIPKVPQSKLEEYYHETDVVICASSDDPMPIVITESLMYGKAVIVSRDTGTAEFIEDGKNGFIFNTSDAEELSLKIQYLIKNPSEIDNIGKEGRNIYKNNFRFEIFYQNLEKIIDEIIKK